MLATILKEDVPLIMDPDSPLNRAHQKERQAERLLFLGRYEAAIDCYQQAAEFIQEAINTTVDPSALFSLKLQHDALIKQPLIIKRRQEESLRKTESVTHSPPWTNKIKLEHRKEVSDIPHTTLANIELPTPTNGYSDEDTQRFSLEEACNSLEETRPLLECLRQHSISEGDNLKYFAGDILEAYDQKPTPAVEVSKVSHNKKKMPKGDQVIIEELQMQNKELCQHIVKLIQNMDHCECENRKLKSRVGYLEQELATLRSQSGTSSEASFREELGTPFSLSVNSSVSVTTPPTEIPPLPPLELPDFDVN
ncbi:nuclear receptor-binding factor 2-like [Amphiura filiformis]|uniref:nuclear receptor-binding factor 2-like n=1 Tax=Amphiura filiformis TaxID=82378 RepID=UPI003B2210C4